MANHEEFIAKHYGHLDQLPAIRETLDQFSKISQRLPIDTDPALSALVQRLQVSHFLFTLEELNGVILKSAEAGSYTAAEALARVSIEVSANLLFVLGGESHGRAKGLIKHHLATSKSRVEKWSRFAEKKNLQSVKLAADQQIRMFSNLEKQFVGLTNPPYEAWPDQSFKKFEAVGHEERYRTLFASSSDSIHLMGADILNLVLCNFEPKDQQPALIRHIHSEKASFAVYLLLYSAIFQGECLYAVTQRVQTSAEDVVTIERGYAHLAEMLARHEADTKAEFAR